jgi:hypothetical protein
MDPNQRKLGSSSDYTSEIPSHFCLEFDYSHKPHERMTKLLVQLLRTLVNETCITPSATYGILDFIERWAQRFYLFKCI